METTNPPSDDRLMLPGKAHQASDQANDAAVTALRAQGAHRADPVRFRYIEVLARKAAAQPQASRLPFDRRLAAVIASCQAQFTQAQLESAQALGAWVQRHPQAADELRRNHEVGDFRAVRRLAARLDAQRGSGPGPLGRLVLHIDGQTQVMPAPGADIAAAGKAANGVRAVAATAHAAPLDELRTLRHFRDTWAGMRVDRQMARSQLQAPENPGPLNSHLLVLRALRRMQDIAPAYLERFMAHTDALMWLDGAKVRNAPAPTGSRATVRKGGRQIGKSGLGKPNG